MSGVCFIPQFVFLCSYVNNDLLAVLFSVISVYFIVLLFKYKNLFYGIISIFFTIAGAFTKSTVLIMIPLIFVVFFVWLIVNKKLILILIFLLIAAIFSVLFYYVLNSDKANYESIKAESNWQKLNLSSHESNEFRVKDYAIKFDGKSNKISLPSTPSLESQELTIELWFYLNKINNNCSTPLISDWNKWKHDSQKGYLVRIFDNKDNITFYQFIICDGSLYKTLRSDSLKDYEFAKKYLNNWIHIACVYKAKTYMKIFINGKEVAVSKENIPEQMMPEKSTPTYIGYSGINPGYFNGIIDEVRIWSIARTGNEINQDMFSKLKGNEEGLIGLWDFDKGKGALVYDLTKNKNNGIIYKQPSYVSPILERIRGIFQYIYNLYIGFKNPDYFNENFNWYSLINKQSFAKTFKSTTAVFGWMNIFADKFVYNYFLAYIISGIVLFLFNVRKLKESKASIIFILLCIISIFLYFLIYAIYSNWIQNQGRIMMTAVLLVYLIAILGFTFVRLDNKNSTSVFYYTLFGTSFMVIIFCLYKYIYLVYY